MGIGKKRWENTESERDLNMLIGELFEEVRVEREIERER